MDFVEIENGNMLKEFNLMDSMKLIFASNKLEKNLGVEKVVE